MKRLLAAIITAAIALTLIFSLAGCGGTSKKQEAIDAFNSATVPFNEAANLINENPDLCDDELISTFQGMSDLLNQYQEMLSGDAEVDDDTYVTMIDWFKETQAWAENCATEFKNALDAAEQ